MKLEALLKLGQFTRIIGLMDNDFILFLVGIGVLIFYLVFSALTEMGTKVPWKK